MHEEIGIHRRYVCHKEMCVFKEKLRCDALEIQVPNLVDKQDLCTIQKKEQGNPMYQI